MSIVKMKDNFIETDLLIVGGGFGGSCSAIKAAEFGLNVTIVEKARTDRCGSSSQGIDHFGAVEHGDVTAKDLVIGYQMASLSRLNGEGRWVDPNLMYHIYKDSWQVVEELERLGINCKWDNGEYLWQVIPRLGMRKATLRVHWKDVKPMLAKAVRRSGVNVLERTMAADLLTSNGRVVGATAVNTRTGEFVVIKAKATILATGCLYRLYDGDEPQPWRYKMRYEFCPSATAGDGYALAYRAGGELANMECNEGAICHRDNLTMNIGAVFQGDAGPTRRFTWTGEDIGDAAFVSLREYIELEQKGLTPLYNSFEHLTEDFHRRTEVTNTDERMIALKISEDRGFDPRTHRYEVMPIKGRALMFAAGVYTDENFNVGPGLFAIGDCVYGLQSTIHAASSGFFVAKNLPSIISRMGKAEIDEAQLETQKKTTLAPLSIKDGTEPMEMECAIRYICERYVGVQRSEGKLREGLRRLGSLRRVFLPRLMAKNPHYLMRALEARNLLDLAEVHLNACLERKESRGGNIRVDYPEQDPSWDNLIICQRIEEGKPVIKIREVPELKPEYAKEAR